MNNTTKRLEEFRKRTDMPQRFEDIEKSLYSGEKYPESEYELSETKLEEFIAESIAQAIAEERERVRAKTKGVRDSLLVYFHNAVNDQKAPYRHAIQAIEEEILSSLDTPLPE